MKRRSGRNKSKRRHSPVRFYSDRDLGKEFPRLLAEAGLHVVSHFSPSAFGEHRNKVSDEDWITFACKRGWVCLTHDDAIRKDDRTLGAVFRSWRPSGALFILRGGVSSHRLASIFLEAHPRVQGMVRRQRATGDPFIATIRRELVKGGIERVAVEWWLNADEWLSRMRKRGP